MKPHSMTGTQMKPRASMPAQIVLPQELVNSPVTPRELRIVCAALLLTTILASLDQTIVNTALPRISSDLGGLSHISWVVTAFLLTQTIAAPLYGKLGDMYGRRRLFVVGISVFLAASALCGVAQTMTQLILFRALQGLGAGGLITLSQTTISDLVGPRARGRYQGIFTSAYAVSSVAGPLIGGFLTTELSWRWVFYVNLPVGALALSLILIGLHRAPLPKSHDIDFAGAFLLAAAATVALLMLNWGGSAMGWQSWNALGMLLVCALFFGLFLRQESRATEPLIDLALFRIRNFSIGVMVSGAMAFAMMGSLVFLPLYFQLVLGLDPARAGLMMVPQIGAMLVSSVVGGQLSSRLGRAKPFLLCGASAEATGLVSLSLLIAHGARAGAFVPALIVLGLGMGIGMINAIVIIQNAAPRTQIGVATATMSFIRSFSGSLGVALAGGLIAARVSQDLAIRVYGFDLHRLMNGGLTLIASLPLPARTALVEAYRHAIGFSFRVSASIMVCALFLIATLRDGRLGETAS